MRLWLLTQVEHCGYDTHDSVVVAAKTEEEAQLINPNGEWGRRWTSWASTPDAVKVEYIGEAVLGTEAGIILASFNAG
jgi:hypothetical protein